MTVQHKGISFVAVPVIADNPRYGWHLVSQTEFSSENKANNMIKRLRTTMNKVEVQHNQCDKCFKKLPTALAFHRHYPRCLRGELD